MIEPSNGRIVWYTPFQNELATPYGMVVQKKEGQVVPLTAQICAVWGNTCVNLLVTDVMGKTFAVTSRTLLQDDSPRPLNGGYAEWMPYQKGQAAKA